MAQLTKADILEPVFKRYSLSSLDDLYATIGFGGLSTLQLLNRLAEEYKKQNKAEAPPPAHRGKTGGGGEKAGPVFLVQRRDRQGRERHAGALRPLLQPPCPATRSSATSPAAAA